MVLTRDVPEKLNKEELISLFVENDDKLNSNMANLTNQLAEVNKTLKRMESQLQISKTINNALEKSIIIVKFSRRKDAESVLRNKNKNKNFNRRSIDIDSSKVFMNKILCRSYKCIWNKCKKLWTEE